MLEDMVRFRKHVGEHAPGDPTLSPALTNGRQTAGIHEIEWTQGLTVSDTFLQFMEHAYRARGDSSARPLNPRFVQSTDFALALSRHPFPPHEC